MRYKQIKFAPPGYIPRIHGYCRVSHQRQYEKGNSVKDQEARIMQYIELRKLDSSDPDFQSAVFHRFWTEPRAQSAYSRELRQRPAGAKLFDDLKPSDYIVVDKLDRMFRNTEDFLASRRYFAERGVGLHFVNFMGMSVDTSSTGGGMFIHMLAMMAELESDRIGERVSLARKARMAQGKHSGGAVPFFCYLQGGKNGKKSGSGGRLEFHQWALDIMPKIVQLHDETGRSFEGIGKDGAWDFLAKYINVPRGDRQNSVAIIRRLYWFYKAWDAAGKPDINTVKITDMVRSYKDANPRGKHGDTNGSQDTDED